MNDYSTGPVFGERVADLPTGVRIPRSKRDEWWDEVLEYVKTAGGDFVELQNMPVSRSTVSTYRAHPEWAPAAFLDPMFEVQRYGHRWWARYIPEAPVNLEQVDTSERGWFL